MDKGASDRNSITEFLANILTPGDNMEYVDGQLLGSGGKPVENIGDKTYYGTLGQANFAGNDPVKDGLLSKMTSAPLEKINFNINLTLDMIIQIMRRVKIHLAKLLQIKKV